MPAKIIGMIGTQQEGVAVHLIKGQISRQWVIDFTRLHEQWNYDSVLVGYYASAAEGFAIALYAADHTERIKFLIAHRPGSVAPALAARQIATFDQLTQGRMALHIIAGTSDADQASEGDFLPKNDRYRRAGEYLDVMRKLWTSDSPIDHKGEFYRIEGGYTDIKPFQQPYPAAVLRRLIGRRAGNGRRDIATCSRSSASRSRRRGSGCRISAAAPPPLGAASASTCRCGRSWRKPRARRGTRRTPCWRMSSARPAPRRSRPTIPPNACSATPRAATCMTSGCGWGLRAPPAHRAIRRAWSERRNRSRRRCWSITGSAFIPSCCAVLRTRTTRWRSAAT